MSITSFGDRALRFDLPPALGALDRRMLLEGLRACEGVVDAVLTETVGAAVLRPGAPLDAARAALAALLVPAPAAASAGATAPAFHTVHVAYDGPDLAAVAGQLGLSPETIITLHSAPEYEVAMLGFMPGFAYLRGLDPRLVVARRAEPRTRVPAGSVAIAAEYTGIYPSASPGGWSLLGEALDHRAFDAGGARFAIGDRVRFEPVPRLARVMMQEDTKRAAAVTARGAHLDVRKAQGLAIVIDAGRVGHMHEGVPHGGPMVPEALARANAAVGNDRGAAAIEVYGAFGVVARGGSVTVADDTGEARVLEEGQSFAVATEGRARARYVAVRGGVDVNEVLGGRGTMLAVGIGGYRGRGLRRGDLIAIGRRVGGVDDHADAHEHGPGHDDDVEVVLGPDRDARVRDAIVGATFRVGVASDRVGMRLEGEPLPAHSMHAARDRPSMPMVQGAIEVTPTGLVVLGPDHPTTGGYPVIGVVRSESMGRLFARPVGAGVRLVFVPE